MPARQISQACAEAGRLSAMLLQKVTPPGPREGLGARLQLELLAQPQRVLLPIRLLRIHLPADTGQGMRTARTPRGRAGV